MRERQFEADLERMFAQAPAMPDADLFAADVERRLNKGWAVRNVALAAAGVIGGAVAVTQALGANVAVQLRDAATGSTRAVTTAYEQTIAQSPAPLSSGQSWTDWLEAGAQSGMGMFWLASGVLVLMAAVAASRVFDEI